MRVIRNHTREQAVELLNSLNQKYGQVYLPESSIYKQYIYYYIEVVDGFEYLFSDSVLQREDVLDFKEFVLTGNPDVDTNFNLGIDIKASYIDISGNNLSTSVLDTELTNVVDNFSNFDPNEFFVLNVGGDEELPLYANETPSESVISAIDTLARVNNIQVNYWDGTKNVSLPSSQVEIKTSNDYEITGVGVVNKGVVSVDEIDESGNVFFMKKEVFQRFAALMNGKKYNESLFKCCVVFDDNLNISQVFEKTDSDLDIELKGLNLAYAPFDFFMTVIALPDLGDPDLTVWNEFIESRKFNQEKFVRVFPDIDLTLIS